MDLVEDLLGCSLWQITQSYWAVRLATGKWLCEAHSVHDWRKGEQRHVDWMDDLASSGDTERITELWLLCPPSHTSPLGNTARLPIVRPCSAFQFKVKTFDVGSTGSTSHTLQAHIIGRVDDAEGNCTCFIYDPIQDGLLTPDTTVYDPMTGRIKVNEDGTPFYPCRNNVHHFRAWRSSVAPPGKLAIDRMGVTI